MSLSDALSRLTIGDRDMMNRALQRTIDKFEWDWKYDASYTRHSMDASPCAAWPFSSVTAFGQFRSERTR